MITEICRAVLRSAFGLSMGAIWQHMTIELIGSSVDYAERVEVFFSIMECLMREGHIRLGCNGSFLVGDIQEQLKILRNARPKEPIEEDELDGFGLWFLTKAPAGVVWIDSDGKEYWT
jgi:hypothetical protein